MKKILITSLLVVMLVITGCGKKEEKTQNNNGGTNGENTPVVEEQVSYEGLGFLNVGAEKGEISTVVINNTGRLLSGVSFTMKVMDSEGNVIVELTDSVNENMETGTTKEVTSKTDADLTKAAIIEYSVVQ